MGKFIADNRLSILKYNNLDDFNKLWALEAPWFEEPNRRRGGWSGVCRIRLQLPEGGECGMFLKRQENHISRTLTHPFSGELTFVREFINIKRFNLANVPALEAVYFEERKVGNDRRAILLTKELEGFYPLDSETFKSKTKKMSPAEIRKKLFYNIASVMQKMHACHFQHNCFYPKHIFVKKSENDDFEVRLIDLEKAKWQPFKMSCVIRDLYTLNRRAIHWSLTERMRFFLIYRQEKTLSEESKRIWRKIAKKTKRNA